ncbi:hypothetical protein Patl1_00674 [Pistacia atlantica]|uniref:Uncharacterized protein n=1 Tax=Pistacia atlantica TaxID=434234 RepID=A0ACC1C4B3_9ROSI|nr:hypothetical protein Patl1_00674 [Pistacia atlantica]
MVSTALSTGIVVVMGIYKEDLERYEAGQLESEKRVKTCIACLWSLVVIMTGGLMLGFWEYEYHPTNSQLWMVPFGLIFLLTPAIIWFAVIFSEFCNSKNRHVVPASSSSGD